MKRYKFIIGLFLLCIIINISLGKYNVFESIYIAIFPFLAGLFFTFWYVYINNKYFNNKHSNISYFKVWNITYFVIVVLTSIESFM